MLLSTLAIFGWPVATRQPSVAFAQTPAAVTTAPSTTPSDASCDRSDVKPPKYSSPVPLMAVAPDGTLYVMEPNQTIFRFHPNASGDAAPDATFCLTYKAKQRPLSLTATRDALYIAALGWVSAVSSSASGPVAPLRTLGDPRENPLDTQLFTNMGPYAVSVGRDGTIYVLSDKSCHCSAGGTSESLDIFSPKARGTAAPTRSLTPEYTVTQGGKKTVYGAYVDTMGIDGQSRLFLVASSLIVSRPGAREPFALETSLRIFDTPETRQVAFDDAGTAYVAQGANIFIVTGATGATPHPTKLAGPKTRITDAESIATDASGKLYVENCADANTSIFVFPAKAHGDVSPLYELHGSQIGLSCPVKL